MPVYERRPPVRLSAGLISPPADQPRHGHDLEPRDLDSDDVCGVVLAGSQGWGDSEFERILRGPLVPVAQTPIIYYAIDWLRRAGVRHASICANDATAPLREYFGDGSSVGMNVVVFEDSEPRGPAGCAHDAARHSHASIFVVVEGCMVPTLDLNALLLAHRRSRAAATIVVEVERRRRPLGSELHGPGGVYVFDRRVLESVPGRGYHDIKQGLIERLYHAGERVLKYEVQGVAPRVLDCATYASVNRWLIGRTVEQPSFLADYVRVGASLIHPTAWVAPTARLFGPVIVGPGVRIEAHAVVVGSSSIGARSRIGAFASISRSLIWDDCIIGERAVVDASLLSDGAVAPADDQLFNALRVARQAPPRPVINWITRPTLERVLMAQPLAKIPRDFALSLHALATHQRLEDQPPLT
jgi:NDP-sugar pyrophosphorylase family protein